MPLSSIDLQFDELTARLGRWRNATVEIARLGVPPHITLLYPWRNAPLKNDDLQRPQAALTDFRPFNLCFNRLETFEAGVIYLALEDETVLRKIMKAIFVAFPDTPPYGGAFTDPSPHLTVAKYSPERLDALRDKIGGALNLPLKFHVHKVVVMEERYDGHWFNRHTIGLQPD